MEDAPTEMKVIVKTAFESQVDSSSEKDDANKKINQNTQEDPLNYFNIPIYKSFKLRICKPLIILKIALFVWYGTGSATAMFLLVFLKKRGITLSELSIIYVITPSVQLLGPTICGIIADKIGRSKIVLVVNLLLTAAIVAGLLLAPSMVLVKCDPQPMQLDCDAQKTSSFISKTNCNGSSDIIQLTSCKVSCPTDFLLQCEVQSLLCQLLKRSEYDSNLSISVDKSLINKGENKCYYNISKIYFENTSFSWCDTSNNNTCKMDCFINSDEGCSVDNSGRKGILVLNTVLIVLFFTVYSNTYRFMDVSTMFQIKRYNSDFGLHRVFSVVGILVFSPIVGYFVDATSIDGEDKNYETALYFFVGMIFLLLVIIYKLEVQIRPPGKNMWRKSLFLLKNTDVLFFILVLIVLGTAWNFNKNFIFLFLETMKPPSFLLGLVNSASALYGLPFLIISNWWIRKVGAPHIFLLALLGYFASGVGYSFLYDPWLSLLIEVSNIFTYHLLWVAVVEHSHNIAPEGITATVIATAGGIHYSIGKGTGGLIGGQLMDAYGGRTAYRVIGLISFTTAIIYSIYLYSRKTCLSRKVNLEISGTRKAAHISDEILGTYSKKGRN